MSSKIAPQKRKLSCKKSYRTSPLKLCWISAQMDWIYRYPIPLLDKIFVTYWHIASGRILLIVIYTQLFFNVLARCVCGSEMVKINGNYYFYCKCFWSDLYPFISNKSTSLIKKTRLLADLNSGFAKLYSCVLSYYTLSYTTTDISAALAAHWIINVFPCPTAP